jgi:hypothetical protein
VPPDSDIRYEMDIIDVRETRRRMITVDRSEGDMSRLDAVRHERDIAAQRRLDEQQLKDAEKARRAERAAAMKEKMDAKLAGRAGGGKGKGRNKKKK